MTSAGEEKAKLFRWSVCCFSAFTHYNKQHSPETALLKVNDDILRAVDNGATVVSLLLDLLAAFDTVDHSLLLDRLKMRFGIKERVPRLVQNPT